MTTIEVDERTERALTEIAIVAGCSVPDLLNNLVEKYQTAPHWQRILALELLKGNRYAVR